MLRALQKARFDSNMGLPSFDKTSLENIEVMLLTIGFNRSGSSLLGFLLTAHPNMVIADEPTVRSRLMKRRGGLIKYYGDLKNINEAKRPKIQILYKADLQEMIDYIISVDHVRWQHGKIEAQQTRSPIASFTVKRDQRYIHVPNQYQGRFKQLKVIGVKLSLLNTIILLEDNILENFKRKLEKSKITLKFIFMVRNPYDIVATIKRIRPDKNSYSIVMNACERNMRILKQIDTREIFISRHEDMVKEPSEQLTKLCDFLQVPIPTGYLEDCASQIAEECYRSRFEYDWPKDEKEGVASLIKKYDFFSGYDWDS